jgi:signal recognition particle GTPase
VSDTPGKSAASSAVFCVRPLSRHLGRWRRRSGYRAAARLAPPRPNQPWRLRLPSRRRRRSRGWFQRLKAGLTKTSAKLSEDIAGIFTKRKLDADTLQELEDLLIRRI